MARVIQLIDILAQVGGIIGAVFYGLPLFIVMAIRGLGVLVKCWQFYSVPDRCLVVGFVLSVVWWLVRRKY